jgi:hypothetical protein
MERTIVTKRDIQQRMPELKAPFLAQASLLGIQEAQLDFGTVVATAMPKEDDYKSKLLKFIPAEVVALYLTLDGVIKAAGSQLPLPQNENLWLVFWVLLIATPLYLWRVTYVTKWLQLVISTLSFAIWVFTLGGPFTGLGWYKPVEGALLLPLYTFFVPMFYEREGKSQP